MDHHSLRTQLQKLENSIRNMGKGTNWLLLEPVDQNLLSELEYLADLLPQTDPPEIKARIERKTDIPKPPIQDLPQKDDITPISQELDPLQSTNLDSLKLRLRDCDRCQLCQTRTTVVFGQGNQKSDIVFIGEGPGEEEDRTGLAFVGKAGKLLTQMIHSIGLNREAVYICNIVKCRPPGNRNPNGEEIVSCYPFLKKQLSLINPKLIITMGNVATKTLIPEALGIMKMRGRIIDYNGITLMPTFHPSYLLRNQSALADVWNDMRKIRQTLHQLRLNTPS